MYRVHIGIEEILGETLSSANVQMKTQLSIDGWTVSSLIKTRRVCFHVQSLRTRTRACTRAHALSVPVRASTRRWQAGGSPLNEWFPCGVATLGLYILRPLLASTTISHHWQFIVSSTILSNIARLRFLGRTVIFIVLRRAGYQKTLVLRKRIVASRNHRWNLIANRKKRSSRMTLKFVQRFCFATNESIECLIEEYEEK